MDLDSQIRTSASLLIAVRDPTSGPAWAAFTARYDGPIRRWCRGRGLAPEAVDAVTQAVLVKLLGKMKSFVYDPRKRFRAWLHTVVDNEVNSYWREVRGRPGTRDSDGSASPDSLPDPDAVAADEALAMAEEQMERDLLVRAACERARGRVKEKTWQAFWLTTLEGRRAEDVAGQLNLPVGAVYVHKNRVLEMIRMEIKGLRVGSNPS